MSPFIHEHFLLRSRVAQRLYHEHAASLPIIDYHCHLDPVDLARNRQFANLAELWVTSDPYKHRAMRIAGVPEASISGSAPDREKFNRWAAVVPLTVGNPLHHWTALELKLYFGIEEPLDADSAGRIWETCNARLGEAAFSARGLLSQRRVALVSTSDRLLDDLSPHRAVAAPRVVPSLRADDVVAFEAESFVPWLTRLGDMTGGAITSWERFLQATAARLDAFDQAGCRLSDHGLDEFIYVRVDEATAAELFRRRARGEALSGAEIVQLRSAALRVLGREYARRGWIMQLHLGAQRQTSTRLRRLAGAAGGYATIGVRCDIPSLCRWFDDLEQAGALPRVNLYPLDPADFVPLAVLTGSFAEDGIAGKLQLGPAWWFNDHATGMRAQLEALANHGLLSTFLGMTTDSRSLLSMARHDYFRRVLCDYIGEQVEHGTFPRDETLLATLVRRLSFENARAVLMPDFPSLP